MGVRGEDFFCSVLFLKSESQTCLNANEKPGERRKCQLREKCMENQSNEIFQGSGKGAGPKYLKGLA